ncbi:hypothetical protein ACFOON_03675 [Novosphingobium piscinae]|uniref:2-dehydro-3-deoxy-6-phosphogalactonate aldolase n=1 Tax=Novosphingobium piscinae TaxID=1507448 RepID=A0A7X1FZS5_9SPHN|nr:hypothetical protein [Novosphingobium piscinae]MBC2669961.1 hypothetical protein [Novosphingobium piscinae]
MSPDQPPAAARLSQALARCPLVAILRGVRPDEGASPAVLKAQRAVLPRAVPVLAVGGVDAGNLASWFAAGADGAGMASSLYQPAFTPAETGRRAAALVDAAAAARAG